MIFYKWILQGDRLMDPSPGRSHRTTVEGGLEAVV